MLAFALLSSAYVQPMAPRSAVGRASAPSMLDRKVIGIDQNGVYESREVAQAKPPLRLLERVEELRLLSSVADAGLLSGAESAGVFSKLESAGAFSTAEKLLPLADDLKLLSTLEFLLNVPAYVLFALASTLVIGEITLITFVPDDNAVNVALQLGTGVAVGLATPLLLAVSYLFSLLQGEN